MLEPGSGDGDLDRLDGSRRLAAHVSVGMLGLLRCRRRPLLTESSLNGTPPPTPDLATRSSLIKE